MAPKPLRCELDNRIQRPGLREKMDRTRYDLERFRSGQSIQSLLVEFNDAVIGAANDQARRHTNLAYRIAGKGLTPST